MLPEMNATFFTVSFAELLKTRRKAYYANACLSLTNATEKVG